MSDDSRPVTLRLVPFHPQDEWAVEMVKRFWVDYTLEGIAEGELHPGVPVAWWLRTGMIMMGKRCAGFVSFDQPRGSIELIYITPKFRGQGLAREVLSHLQEGGAEQGRVMRLKGPLSPGTQRIAEELGIPVAENEGAELIKFERQQVELRKAHASICPHTGDELKFCDTCVRKRLVPGCRTAIDVMLGRTPNPREARMARGLE